MTHPPEPSTEQSSISLCGWCGANYSGDKMIETAAESKTCDGFQSTGICPKCLDNIRTDLNQRRINFKALGPIQL